MPISLTTLLVTLSSIFRPRAALELENLALRHQIGVLQRSARKRLKLTSGDRLVDLSVPPLRRTSRSCSSRKAQWALRLHTDGSLSARQTRERRRLLNPRKRSDDCPAGRADRREGIKTRFGPLLVNSIQNERRLFNCPVNEIWLR